jgi:hypothetical protein
LLWQVTQDTNKPHLSIIEIMLKAQFFVGLALLFTGLFGSRFVAERAAKLLSAEEKLKLLDSFSRLRVFGALPLMFILFLFLGIIYVPHAWRWPAYFGVCALFVGYFVILQRTVSRKFTELGINASYCAAYNRARWISYSAWLAFFIVVTLAPFLSR